MNKFPAALGFGSGSSFEAVLPRPEGATTSSDAPPPSIFRQILRMAMRWRRYIIGAIVGCLILGLIITFLMTPMYRATTTIEIARESNRIVNIQGVQQEASDADQEFYQTQYGLLKSRALAERVALRTGVADDPTFFSAFSAKLPNSRVGAGGRYTAVDRSWRQEVAGGILLKYVRVIPPRASRLVEITFSSPDPALSAKIVNAWSTNFIDLSLERRYEATSYARRFLEDRLGQLRVRLEQSERALVAFASRQRIVDVPTENGSRSIVGQDLAETTVALSKATADRLDARARYDQALRAGGATREALANPALNTLRQRRAELAANYQRLLVQFQPDYPAAREIAKQMETIDRSIGREEGRVSNSLQTELRTTEQREAAIRERVEALKNDVLNLRRRSIQYNIYQREVDTNRSLYDGLLQRYKEIGVAGGIGVNNVAIVDTASVPITPASPRLLLNLLLALVAGTLIGGAIAYVLDQSDESIADPDEVEKLFSLPLLGVVPRMAGHAPLDALADPKSELVDAYLTIQSNLSFSTSTGIPKVLAVTSTRPAEGKSTTAFALAALLARTGRKVLLIDGDMRSPSVSGLLDLDGGIGLSNYLSGDDGAKAAIHHEKRFGIDVFVSGPVPPNAAELLTGNRLTVLLDLLREEYDHVVIDAPPVVGLADAPLIGSRADALIFVVVAQGIRFTLVKVALSRLSAAHARPLGVVLTKFDSKRAHYGYEYGYDYGQKNDKIIAGRT